jgi:hypothetical protein
MAEGRLIPVSAEMIQRISMDAEYTRSEIDAFRAERLSDKAVRLMRLCGTAALS